MISSTATGQFIMGNYQFGDFELNLDLRVLARRGQRVPVGPKAYDLLTCLVSHARKPVSKAELLKAVWPDAYVEDGTLAQHIFSLRKALGDQAHLIVTVPGIGYCFAGEARLATPPSAQPWSPSPIDDVIHELRERTHVVIEEPIQQPHVAAKAVSLRSQYLAGGALLVALAALAGWRWSTRNVPGDHHEIVLGSFENATGEAAFDGTLNTALAIDLKESPYLRIAGEGRTRDTLKLMERSPDDSLTPALAREVCQRMNDQAVLRGTIARFGQKYLIILTAADCASGNELVQTKAVADGSAGVLQAVDSAASEMRRKLGEPLRSLKSFNTPLSQKMTASLPALKVYSQAESLANQGKSADAIPLFQEAIALDPTFAIAYAQLALMNTHIGQYEASNRNYRKAYEMRDHAAERDRFFIVNQYERFNGTAFDILRNLEKWTEMYPDEFTAWALLSNGRITMTWADQAVEPARRAVQLDPRNAFAYELLARSLQFSGQIAEAKAVGHRAIDLKIDGAPMHQILLAIAVYEHDEPAIAAETAWGKGTSNEPAMKEWVASMLFGQGKARAEEQVLEEAADEYRHAGLTEIADRAVVCMPREQAELGRIDEARRLLRKPNPFWSIDEDAIAAYAETGDLAHAEQYVQKILSFSPNDPLTQFRVAEDKAEIDMARKEPERAIADLQPALPYQFRGLYIPLMLGQAYLAAGRPDLARQSFRNLLDHSFIDPVSASVPLAHLGLARGYAAEHDAAASRAEYETFLTLWKDADPDLPVLLAAKAELARLR